MNYGVIEIHIATYLNAKFSDLNLSNKFFAAAMPETDKEYKEFEAQVDKTRVAVEYAGSDFEKPSSVDVVRQAETIRFRLMFDGRKMRGEDGLFTMEEHIKNFLLGYRLPDSDPLYISGSGDRQFQPGVWMPYLEFECRTLIVQTVEHDFDGIIGGPFIGLQRTPESFTGEMNSQEFV